LGDNKLRFPFAISVTKNATCQTFKINYDLFVFVDFQGNKKLVLNIKIFYFWGI
jgi:hypothetical protein